MMSSALCFLLALGILYVEGFAIIGSSNQAITAVSLTNGAAVVPRPYRVEDELPDSQNWVADAEGYIRINHYPNLVLVVDNTYESITVTLRDVSLLTTNTNKARWYVQTASDGRYTIRSMSYPLINLIAFSFDGTFTFWNPFPTFDYIVAGAGTAGCKIAKRLSDNFERSVLTIEAGKRVDDNPLVQQIATIREVEGTATFNFQYYSERIANLGMQKVPCGVGKMWGGTSNHNGMLYTKGLRYDWQLMEKYGGSQWNYDKYIKQIYISQENYTGVQPGVYGHSGELSIVDSAIIPDNIEDPVLNATHAIYPDYGPFDLDSSVKRFKLTQVNLTNNHFIRESSSRAYFNASVVTPDGQGVGGRKLTVISEAFVDRLIFHPIFTHRAIGVWFIDRDGMSRRAYANKEVVLSAGVYGSPAILMRSGVGNCTDLAAINITCLENNKYVGSNLQDHVRVQVEVTVPHIDALEVLAAIYTQNTDGHLLEGVMKSPLAPLYTDPSVNTTVQPDSKFSMLVASQIPYAELNTLFNLNWLSTLSFPAIFEFAAVLLRPKCAGQLKLATSLPTAYPIIASNYLCHPDDLNWAKTLFRGIMDIVDVLHANDSSYVAIFPAKTDIDTDAKLTKWVRGLTTSYRHPVGTNRMGARDDIQQGVVDSNLCVYGIQRVRVGDASIFPVIPSANPQASIYAVGGKVVDFINNPLATCSSRPTSFPTTKPTAPKPQI